MAIDTEERKAPSSKNPKGGKSSNPGNNKKVVIIVLSIVGGLIVLSIVGMLLVGLFTKKAVDTVVDRASDGHVKVEGSGDNTKVKVKGEDGKEATFESTTKLPKGFPSAVPLYDNAKLKSASTVDLGDDGKSYTLAFASSDKPDDVNNFYTKALSSNGWETISSSTSSDSATIMGKNESKNLSVIVGMQAGDNDKGTAITMTTSVKPNQ